MLSFTLACGTTSFIEDVVDDFGTTSATIRTSKHRFSGETERLIETLDVPGEAKVVDLRIKSNLKSGEIVWVLIDPTGGIRWEEQIEGATIYSESRRFDAVTGEWILQIDIVGAAGSYDIFWEAKN